MTFIIYTTYHIGVTNFGDYRTIIFVPWYATAKILFWFRFLWGLTCRRLPVRLPRRRSRPETYKANILLKAIALSGGASAFVTNFCPQCWCMCNQLFLTFVYSSTLSKGAHEWTLTEKDVASTRLGSIVVSSLESFIRVRLIIVQWEGVLYTCQRRSYVYALCSELAPTHKSSLPCHWQHSVSSSAVACLKSCTSNRLL